MQSGFERLRSYVKSLSLGRPRLNGDVTVYPLFAQEEPPLTAIDLDEALSQNLVEISEVSQEGSVPEIRVRNLASYDLLIFDGEQLVGARQDRIVNATLMVEARSELVVPVSCVEGGRWHYQSARFRAGRSFLYPSLRADKFADVSSSLRSGGGHRSHQGRIWADLSAKSGRMGVHSRTGAMKDLFDDPRWDVVQEARRIPFLKGQVGYLAFIRGGFAGGDVFATRRLCKQKFRKLMQSYYLDSLDPALSFPPLEASQVLKKVLAATPIPCETVGKGADFRFEDELLQGSWKLLPEGVAHLTILPRAVTRAEHAKG